METPLLDVRHVNICYNESPVVHDVSFQVKTGEILGIVGESGSGKSTLIQAAMGLLGKGGSVEKGSIFYRGQSVLEAGEEELRRMRGPAMGMIFQNTGASLCPVRSVGDQLYECAKQHGNTSPKEVRQRALELLKKMRLPDGDRILNSYPFELSGGTSQRVGILMAMILQPDLLFADEPTSALDVTVQAQVVQEMIQMRSIYQTGIVIVTHNIGVVERMADNVAVMHQGRLIEYGTTQDVICHPQETYTKKLIDAALHIRRK